MVIYEVSRLLTGSCPGSSYLWNEFVNEVLFQSDKIQKDNKKLRFWEIVIFGILNLTHQVRNNPKYYRFLIPLVKGYPTSWLGWKKSLSIEIIEKFSVSKYFKIEYFKILQIIWTSWVWIDYSSFYWQILRNQRFEFENQRVWKIIFTFQYHSLAW